MRALILNPSFAKDGGSVTLEIAHDLNTKNEVSGPQSASVPMFTQIIRHPKTFEMRVTSRSISTALQSIAKTREAIQHEFKQRKLDYAAINKDRMVLSDKYVCVVCCASFSENANTVHGWRTKRTQLAFLGCLFFRLVDDTDEETLEDFKRLSEIMRRHKERIAEITEETKRQIKVTYTKGHVDTLVTLPHGTMCDIPEAFFLGQGISASSSGTSEAETLSLDESTPSSSDKHASSSPSSSSSSSSLSSSALPGSSVQLCFIKLAAATAVSVVAQNSQLSKVSSWFPTR